MLGLVRQLLRRRHVRHRRLVAHPGLVAVERHRHGEYRLAVLDRDDAPGGEALAVADAIDLVDDRHLGVAAAAGNRRAANAAAGRPRRRCGRPRPAPARSPVRRTRAASPPAASGRGTGSPRAARGRGWREGLERQRTSKLAACSARPACGPMAAVTGARYHTRFMRRVKRSDRIALRPAAVIIANTRGRRRTST